MASIPTDVVIPAEIRARHGLTAGTQVEFVDESGVIRLGVSDPAAGFGLVKIKRAPTGGHRRLSDFDAGAMLKRPRSKR